VIGSCRKKKHTVSTGKDLARSRACVVMAVKKRHCIPLHKPQMHSVLDTEVSHFISYLEKVTGR